MNLLASLDWRTLAREYPGLFDSVTVSSQDVLGLLAERALVDVDVREFLRSLREDPQVVEVLMQCVLHVSVDSDYWLSATGRALPVNRRPRTWLEAHPMDDDRWLVLPGESTAGPTLSFWRYDAATGRPAVVSIVADPAGRVAGVLFHRSKQCQEEFERAGTCLGTDDGCRCEISKSFEGPVVINICECAAS
jgi:hypothetical protein